jgi:CBS domain-containing protein
MQNVSITRIMTSYPTTVEPNSSVAAAERLMREKGCHHLPVVEGIKVVGLLNAHDLLKALVLRGDARESDSELLRRPSLQKHRVADVMQRNVRSLPHSATLLDAAIELRPGDTHAIPVLGADGRLIGLVTAGDVMQALIDELRRPAASPPATRQAQPAAHDEEDTERKALREVYRAVRNYLGSGRAEIEHGRLLRAANRAREALRTADVEI